MLARDGQCEIAVIYDGDGTWRRCPHAAVMTRKMSFGADYRADWPEVPVCKRHGNLRVSVCHYSKPPEGYTERKGATA